MPFARVHGISAREGLSLLRARIRYLAETAAPQRAAQAAG